MWKAGKAAEESKLKMSFFQFNVRFSQFVLDGFWFFLDFFR